MADEQVKPTEFSDTQAVRITVSWLKKHFSKTSVATIGTVLVACGGYVLSVHSDLKTLEAKIDRLSDRIPSGDFGVSSVRDDLSHVRENVGVIEQRIEAQDRALQRIYDRFDMDFIESMAPLSKRKRK